jgi:TRAP-type mannitol/chloroaromatic compound transport system permease large subunit
MATSIAAILLVGSFLLLVILRIPIAFCLGVSSFLAVLYLGMPVEMVAQRVANGINSFSLLAVPFFMLAGQIMGDGGIAERLIALAKLTKTSRCTQRAKPPQPFYPYLGQA